MKGTTSFNPSFMAGFTLAGYQMPDGTIQSTYGAKMNGWPDSITIEDTTFNFDYAVVVGNGDNPEDRLINAEYV